MYFKKEKESVKEECKLRYEENYKYKNDNEEYEYEEEDWYKIYGRNFAPDPVPTLYIPPLIW